MTFAYFSAKTDPETETETRVLGHEKNQNLKQIQNSTTSKLYTLYHLMNAREMTDNFVIILWK